MTLKVQNIGDDITLIDLFDLGLENRTGAYVLHEKELTIIETSASPSVPYLLKGLESLGIDPKDVKNIIVTHIHLDHSGGVGLFLEHCPKAKVFVHPRGKRHLQDPSRLIASAKMVYGEEQFQKLFDPILPVPEDQLVVKEDLETLQVGDDRVLTFYHTPGHANHHFCIHDSKSNGIFTGDTIGVFYSMLLDSDLEFYLPSTSPNQFDPDKMLESCERIEALNVSKIFFGHFGMSEHPEEVCKQLKYWLAIFVDQGKAVVKEHGSLPFEEKSKLLSDRLYSTLQDYLKKKHISEDHQVHEYLKIDMGICAQGIIDYLQKEENR
uniref:MBL fold metallo-hydrolase n=1 Tax=Aeribacillus sp. FSL K6-8210 TaxID=2954683 RepID=UPI00403F3C87